VGHRHTLWRAGRARSKQHVAGVVGSNLAHARIEHFIIDRFAQRQEGIDIQIYCALIVCILIQQISGKKPNKAMRNMIGWYLLGLADEQDVVNFLNRPDNTGVKLRAKEELWKKLGF